jgi:FkbM family methyltransferase
LITQPVIYRTVKTLPLANRYHWLLKIRPAPLACVLKLILGVKRTRVDTASGSFLVDPASDFGDRLLCHGSYEPTMVKALKRCLRPGGIFIDVGANEGYFSIIASRLVGHKGKVFAVEPQARLQKVLKENLELNECKNVTAVPLAISGRGGDLRLLLSPSTNTGSSSMIRTTKYPLTSQSVHSCSLSNLFDRYKISHCDLVKIDVEGYEAEVLEGAGELLRLHKILAIALEYHPLQLSKIGLTSDQIHLRLIQYAYDTVKDSPVNLYLAQGREPS